MDNNSGRAAQAQVQIPVGSGAAGEGGDWRTRLLADSRHRIVNKILDTLKRHLPFSGQEGLEELKMIAVRFEEKIYTVATSQSDYLRKISLKMLTMENKSQNPVGNPMPANATCNSTNSSDQASDPFAGLLSELWLESESSEDDEDGCETQGGPGV